MAWGFRLQTRLATRARGAAAAGAEGAASAAPPAAYSAMDVDGETDSNHDTALTLACAGGHEELVELLLSRGADIEHRDKKVLKNIINQYNELVLTLCMLTMSRSKILQY